MFKEFVIVVNTDNLIVGNLPATVDKCSIEYLDDYITITCDDSTIAIFDKNKCIGVFFR